MTLGVREAEKFKKYVVANVFWDTLYTKIIFNFLPMPLIVMFGDLLGMVVGRFNEVYNDPNKVIEKMAESRVNMVARRDGRQLSDNFL